ncbi:MAG: FAD-dependent oxidoreductase [Planctomycetota bacterium]
MRPRVGVLVVGGGVCGLWTLWSLRARGHDAWLVEGDGLGSGQTLASQGILHAGVKYRLPGNTTDSSKSVADVQPVWEAALAGRSGPDLSSVRTVSAVTHLWSLPSLGARMAAEVATRVMRSGTARVDRGRSGDAFAIAPKGVAVFEASERVIEPLGIVASLRGACGGRARSGRCVGLEHGDDGFIARIAGADDGVVEVEASSVVCAAGIGNEALISELGGDAPSVCQRRPLHQVVGRGAPVVLNGHCLQASDKPALTVTTGELDGERTWYLGGDLAETGVGLSSDEQCTRARTAVERCLGWLDVSGVVWSSFEIDRAEGKTEDGKRPDGPVVREIVPGVVAVWPTKLVLAPVAAERVVEAIGMPRGGTGEDGLGALPEARVGEVVW